MPLSFSIAAAACWKPGADASIYEKFPVALHAITDEVPPLPQCKLPTKRRLSSWCKAMLVCAEDCVLPQACKQASPRVQGYEAPVGGADDEKSAVPTIFASKHGERAREVGMLIDYTRGEGVSQGGFSLSVHNVAASLFSISQENRQPYSAIAAGEETFEAGLLEAVMHLEKYERVLLVVGDEQAPKDLPDEVTLPQVHALLLKRGNDFAIENKLPPSSTGCFCSSLQSNEEEDPRSGQDVGSAMSAHDFFSFVNGSETELCGATIKISR